MVDQKKKVIHAIFLFLQMSPEGSYKNCEYPSPTEVTF